jgi:hypothetical protein
MRIVFVLLVSLSFVACAPDETANPAHCDNDGDCGAGRRCYRNLCVVSGDTGVMTDSAVVDSGAEDSSVADTAPADTAPADTGGGCPAERECDGECCNSFETCCNDPSAGPTCVDTSTDEDHCGECNNGCIATRCSGGSCLIP